MCAGRLKKSISSIELTDDMLHELLSIENILDIPMVKDACNKFRHNEEHHRRKQFAGFRFAESISISIAIKKSKVGLEDFLVIIALVILLLI